MATSLAQYEPSVFTEMETVGVGRPPELVWDDEIHKFDSARDKRKGRKSGWYVAHPPTASLPAIVVFGDWHDSTRTFKWVAGGNGAPDDFDIEKYRQMQAEMRAKREAEQAEKWEQASAEAHRRWDEAVDATVDHPYLAKKGVTELERPGALKQKGEMLMIPLYSFETLAGGMPKLASIQYVWPDGKKRYLKGSKTSEVKATIGARYFDPDQEGCRLYICEGWATGWTISKAMEAAVFVCFSTNNLEAAAIFALSRYPLAEIIVAADNDRWTTDPPNPGATEARRIAEKHGVEWCAPDFVDPQEGRTDYNDLMLAEGWDVVRTWLEPNEAKHASLSPPALEPEVVDPTKEKERPTGWLSTARFRVLGHDRGHYYYLPQSGGQVVSLTPPGHERISNLCQLEHKSWWEANFPASRAGADTKGAADAMMQEAHRKGIYQAENLRGRGCWLDYGDDGSGGLVFHLGDRMIVPGSQAYVPPESYESPGGYMYEKEKRLKGPWPSGPHGSTMDVDEARQVLDVFRSLMWKEPGSGDLLAGWTALAPICGALRWRPHVWMLGERGSGKSTVMTDIIVPLLGGKHRIGGMCVYVHGETTEAGIRQDLGRDALPVVFDEAEEGEGVGSRIQRVIALARQASTESDASVLKGTTHGSSLRFQVRSMFCFASIGGAVYMESDRSRVSMLTLKGRSMVSAAEKMEHWEMFQPKMQRITTKVGRRMLTRTLGWLRDGRLDETLDVFVRSAAVHYGDQRLGDQYGTLFAGAWLLQSDEVPTPSEATDLINNEDVSVAGARHTPEGQKALAILLQQRERVDSKNGVRTMAVGQLVDIAGGAVSGACTEPEASSVLQQLGIRTVVERGERVLLIAVNSEWVLDKLKGTIYARNFGGVMSGLDGVVVTDKTLRFHRGLVGRAVRIPYELLDGSE